MEAYLSGTIKAKVRKARLSICLEYNKLYASSELRNSRQRSFLKIVALAMLLFFSAISENSRQAHN